MLDFRKRSKKTKNMFRKLISNLSFSPSLVGQLSFYAGRLKKEQLTRRLGVIFVVLAVIVQCLAVFSPPTSANAADSNDLVYGGIRPADGGLSIFLKAYDNNVNGLRDIMNYFGITRAEISGSSHGAWQNVASFSNTWYSVNHRQQGVTGERGLQTVNSSTGQSMTFYIRPWYRTGNQSSVLYGFKGYSGALNSKTGNGTFYLMDICGNLVIQSPPPVQKPVTPGKITYSKAATNVTQNNIDATTAVAHAGDKIAYTLTAKNVGETSTTASFKDDLTDTLEYAKLVDNGGGTFDNATKTMSWPDVTVTASESISRTFTVQLLDQIPATPAGISNPTSYDCRVQNVFGSQVVVNIECPTPKVVEQTVENLPHTGPTENLIFATILVAITVYFYARSRQLGQEVRLVRKNLTTGAI